MPLGEPRLPARVAVKSPSALVFKGNAASDARHGEDSEIPESQNSFDSLDLDRVGSVVAGLVDFRAIG